VLRTTNDEGRTTFPNRPFYNTPFSVLGGGMNPRIAVIGSGSWGTALARLLGNKFKDVIMWAHEPEVAASINEKHRNSLFLTDIDLPSSITATNDIARALEGRHIVFSVVPAQSLRKVWEKAAKHLSKDAVLVSCTKGIEANTLKLPAKILADCLPNHPENKCVYLSGPSFAQEVAKDLPTAVTIAGTDPDVSKEVQAVLRTDTFLTFTHDDVIGVEVGGAVKNVIAIATGVGDGLGYGRNTRAAIITRGLYEISKIGLSMGAKPHTFMGLAGMGDLVLTATDELSRNYSVGKRLGSGEDINDIISSMTMVAEGYATASAVHEYASRSDISTPICETVYQMLYKDLAPRDAAQQLCSTTLAKELRAFERETGDDKRGT
jgi:glycerol-3-phosphate dehydrogenase (NAD(P)+)